MMAILEEFEIKEAAKIHREQMAALENFYTESYEALSGGLIDAIKKLVAQAEQMQKQEQKPAIAYIICAMLRSTIYDDKATARIDAYGDKWYGDLAECFVPYDVDWAFDFLKGYIGSIKDIARKSYSGLYDYHLEGLGYRHAGEYFGYVEGLMAVIQPNVEEIITKSGVQKNERLDVRVGEYFDLTRKLFVIGK